MKPLPDPETLAKLVSNVTSMMFGVSFSPVAGPAPSVCAGDWRTAVLPIDGSRPMTVGLASDASSCGKLSAAMFSCRPDEVDRPMMDDSLRELANMTAGLVKSNLGLDALLGLPRISPGASIPPTMPLQAVFLKADSLGLLLWVTEGHVAA